MALVKCEKCRVVIQEERVMRINGQIICCHCTANFSSLEVMNETLKALKARSRPRIDWDFVLAGISFLAGLSIGLSL